VRVRARAKAREREKERRTEKEKEERERERERERESVSSTVACTNSPDKDMFQCHVNVVITILSQFPHRTCSHTEERGGKGKRKKREGERE